MKKSSEGRTILYLAGGELIKKGIFWIIVGLIVNALIFLFVAYTNFPLGRNY